MGGFLQTISTDGFLFEKGPKIFKAARSPALLELIDALGLTQQRIASNPQVNRRYVWSEDKLNLLPTNLAGFLTSSMTRPLLRALFTEWQKPAHEMIEHLDFIVRRFNKQAAERLFDPLIVRHLCRRYAEAIDQELFSST